MCIFIRATIWVGFIPSLSPMSPLFYPFWQSFGGELLGSWASKKRTKTPKTLFMRAIQEVTPPKFNSSPLKNHGKGRWIYFWDALLLRGYVKFPGCIYIILYIVKTSGIGDIGGSFEAKKPHLCNSGMCGEINRWKRWPGRRPILRRTLKLLGHSEWEGPKMTDPKSQSRWEITWRPRWLKSLE